MKRPFKTCNQRNKIHKLKIGNNNNNNLKLSLYLALFMSLLLLSTFLFC